MYKRYKKQSLESNLFHHGLIKILLTHHLKTIGDFWDGFLVRNGFVPTISVDDPNLGESLVKEHFDSPNNKPATKSSDAIKPSQFPHEQQAIVCERSETLVPDLDSGHNANMKPYVKKSHK